MLLNEKMKEPHNSSFSFQNPSEKPSPIPSDFHSFIIFDNTGTKSRDKFLPKRRSDNYSSFRTPSKSQEKALSERSVDGQKSYGKFLHRSIIEGLKFIHLKDKNPSEMKQIRDLENEQDLTHEKVRPHLLENKTRIKKDLKEKRDEIKTKKAIIATKSKTRYRSIRGSSLKKMKAVLDEDHTKIKKIVK